MDKLQVINLALMKCGLPLAASLEDCDWNAAYIFDQCARETLRSYAWGFAQKYTSLTRGDENPQFGFNYSYKLPSDCLRIIDIHSSPDLRAPKCRFRVQGRNVCTSANPAWGRYTGEYLNPEDWPADFCDAVACCIAMKIAGLSAQNMQLVQALMQMYQISLQMAQLNDARENCERIDLEIPLQESRQIKDNRK